LYSNRNEGWKGRKEEDRFAFCARVKGKQILTLTLAVRKGEGQHKNSSRLEGGRSSPRQEKNASKGGQGSVSLLMKKALCTRKGGRGPSAISSRKEDFIAKVEDGARRFYFRSESSWGGGRKGKERRRLSGRKRLCFTASSSI